MVGTVYGAFQISAPTGARFLFIVIGIVGAVATVSKLAAASIAFVIGWIFGALLLKSLWGVLDYIVFAAAIVIVIYIVYQFLLKH